MSLQASYREFAPTPSLTMADSLEVSPRDMGETTVVPASSPSQVPGSSPGSPLPGITLR